MKMSISIKLDEKKLKKYTPNPIYEYAELIEVLREHGFVHRNPMDIGFINEDATEELAQKAISDALERLSWLNTEGIIIECCAEEIGDTTDLTQMFKNPGK
ncbi:MAG: hypothetical protein K2K38_04000 [Clostridia bacterium]|nr:hypothetical protein [Clostridia bacterium]